jgi:hypothetical protein
MSAVLASQLSRRTPDVSAVLTEDFDFRALADWVRTTCESLVTFDINVFSNPAALELLASSTQDTLTVYDDHLGLSPQKLPENVTYRNLLPPRADPSGEIRPTSMFVHALLNSEVRRSPRNDFLCVAAAHGEGVRERFRKHLPMLAQPFDRLARVVGRGANAFFTLPSATTLAPALVAALVAYGRQSAPIEIGEIEGSDWVGTLRDATSEVDHAVEAIVAQARSQKPYAAGDVPIYITEVRDDRRIVNLVASSLRVAVDEGVSVAWQRRRGGVAVELRRARSLSSPDLADALLSMNPTYFVSRGGHPMAAGATVREESFHGFTQSLLAALRAQGHSPS